MDLKSIMPKDPPLAISITPIFDNIQVFKANNRNHILYELLVMNGTKKPIRFLGIKINGKNFEQLIYGKDLNTDFAKISTANTTLPEDPVLNPNETGVIYILLDFDKVPNTLEHHIIVQTKGDASTIQSIILNPIKLNKTQAIIMTSPLKGNRWYALGADNNFVLHRRSIFILNGKIKIPERTAVDFLQYGPNGLYNGDPLKNTSYYSYGQ